MNQIKILIVEDEGLIALDIEERLKSEGYDVIGIADSGKNALKIVNRNIPDVIIMDINLNGDLNGIETVTLISKIKKIPFIYLSALSDVNTWENAKQTLPAAFLIKPFRNIDLSRALELAIFKVANENKLIGNSIGDNIGILKLQDRFFIENNKGNFEKIMNVDLLYLEADRSYCNVFTRSKKYTLSCSLSEVLSKNICVDLIRIHKSFAIHIRNVDAINDHSVLIGGQQIPIGNTFRNNMHQSFFLL
jgi:DNA-binding LytR/AlgR family response regulator